MRLGLYDPIKVLVGATASSSPLLKFLAGALAGAVGSLVGNPFNVIKLKMMANKDERGPADYVKEVWQNQGIKGFYTGFGSSVIRAMIMNATQMGVYDIIKSWIIATFGFEGLLMQFCASTIAGFFLCVNAGPIDMIMVKLTTQSTIKEEQKYNGILGTAIKIF